MLRRPRGLSNAVLTFVLIFGLGSGYYIWEPSFRQLNTKPVNNQNQTQSKSD
jgi:hypothetical protein